MTGITQDSLVILLLRVGLLSGFTSIVAWTVVYTVLSKGRNWRSPIGRSFLRFALLIAALLVPFTLSLFVHLTRLNSRIVSWVDVVLIAAVSVEMAQRIIVFLRIGPAPRRTGAGHLPGDGLHPIDDPVPDAGGEVPDGTA